MNWLLRKLGAAVVSGVGWKLGADVYEAVKQRVQKEKRPEDKGTATSAQATVVECGPGCDVDPEQGGHSAQRPAASGPCS